MTTARDIMTPAPKCVGENDTLVDAAVLMASLDVGALPICGEDKTPEGHAHRPRHRGEEPRRRTATRARRGPASSPRASPSRSARTTTSRMALDLMKKHQIRRLPVIEDHLLVGIISQADIALSMSSKATGETVEEISE